MKKLTLFGISCLALSIVSTTYASDSIHDEYTSYKGWVEKTSFPYKVGVERKTKIVLDYHKLKVGLSKSEVESILGYPDFSQPNAPKVPGQTYTGSTWTYYFSKPNPNITNRVNDIGVHVFFNISGNLKWAVPMNIENLNELGNPEYSKQ